MCFSRMNECIFAREGEFNTTINMSGVKSTFYLFTCSPAMLFYQWLGRNNWRISTRTLSSSRTPWREKCLTYLQQVLLDMLNAVPPNIRRVMWFQQNVPTAHYVRDVRNYLDITLTNRWIGRDCPVAWPPRMPDFSCPHFFMQGSTESAEGLVARLSASAGGVSDMPVVFRKFANQFFAIVRHA